MRFREQGSGAGCGKRVEACSACPGDYKDSDRSARNSREAEDAADPDEEFEATELLVVRFGFLIAEKRLRESNHQRLQS